MASAKTNVIAVQKVEQKKFSQAVLEIISFGNYQFWKISFLNNKVLEKVLLELDYDYEDQLK